MTLVRGKYAEQDFQISVVQFLASNGLRGVAVPNEGMRSRGALGRMIAAGLTPGFQDLLVFDRRTPRNASVNGVVVARGSRGLLCVAELKSRKGKMRDTQDELAEDMRARGVPVFGPWRTLDQVQRDLLSIGVDLKARV